jgi:[ribosomal protein S5]-alanine N-acetyltransferase
VASTEASPPTIALGPDGWVLRAWRRDDAASLARHADNVNVWRWMSDSFPHPYTLQIAEHWCTRGHVEFGGDNWAIALNDEAVGGCGIQQGQAQFVCSAEVGWWLAQEHWGRGIASRVARALVTRGFETARITRLFAPIHAGNTRSMRVAEKAGFVLEGIQRKSAIKAGRPIDRHLYALVR